VLKAKKKYGQHFLHDENIVLKIINAFMANYIGGPVLEIGPGKGALTKHLMRLIPHSFTAMDIDGQMIDYLKELFPDRKECFVEYDALKLDFTNQPHNLSVIGNFPYNISSRLLFEFARHHSSIACMVGMFQKEVARRITAAPHTAEYGILSVLLQAFYQVEFLFEVNAGCFTPRPAVTSAIIHLKKKNVLPQLSDEKLFFSVVKKGFNQRRKMLRNALHEFRLEQSGFQNVRAQDLRVEEWIELTNLIAAQKTELE
jgi:16S rRNA (adenine1518-N6/adenine1519-N6)-dimethyltransferase